MPAAGLANRLRVSVAISNGQPFVLYDGDQKFRGGLARDIIDHLATELSLSPEYLNVPRARLEYWLRSDRIDAACFLAPAWVAQPDSLHWSPPLFSIRQVVVSHQAAPAVTRPEHLFGQRVGVVLNYVYPELQPYFADGRIQRTDAPSGPSNLAKLQRRRIDAYVDIDLTVLHGLESGELSLPVRVAPLWAAANPVYCAFGPAFATRHPNIGRILSESVSTGQVETWIQRYTGGRRIADAAAAGVN